jgi:cyclophilin family peptidyl-prolyl cis-trans isomerase
MVNGSQFVIALADSNELLAEFSEFTPFGRVVSGLDVAEAITPGTKITAIDIREE